MGKTISISFARGARRVTGSNFLVEAKDGETTTRILIDCGLAQGERFCESTNREVFSYDPATINVVFFTHAHADHIGLFPKLVKDGFKGRALTTAPTKALTPIMLEDSVKIIALEAKRCNDEPPYATEDVIRAVEYIDEVAYGKVLELAPGITATLHNAGHILGSATVLLDIFGKKILFTGDLGRVPAALVPDREVPTGVEYLVTESVYGNKTHGSLEESEQALLSAVKGVVANQGTLLIPAFSLERTQIILASLDKAITNGVIPPVAVFMDSPLAAKVTDVYRKYPAFLRADIRTRLESGDDPFSFPSLKVSVHPDESDAIDRHPGPKIIIAGAGMSHGGRIRRHEAKYLPQKSTTLLLVGYQVPGSLGRRLKDGAWTVSIDGVEVKVRATILSTDGFSAHADRDDLMTFAENVNPKHVFVILGETEAATFLAQRIAGFLNIPVDVPREGETYDIPLV
ncbi:MBL fold metallo-hydrolase [Patescibacteria group bacterium]|nr:MAG: MBL fold metallo-hydrolase [Patescibacteria group bacterium]